MSEVRKSLGQGLGTRCNQVFEWFGNSTSICFEWLKYSKTLVATCQGLMIINRKAHHLPNNNHTYPKPKKKMKDCLTGGKGWGGEVVLCTSISETGSPRISHRSDDPSKSNRSILETLENSTYPGHERYNWRKRVARSQRWQGEKVKYPPNDKLSGSKLPLRSSVKCEEFI